ncbi:hypothetical protein DFQ26_002131 [Actinomortierella ambigua]|nr:hypothetical protein DFQ26_002131 [Actinomortierella ambigua]
MATIKQRSPAISQKAVLVPGPLPKKQGVNGYLAKGEPLNFENKLAEQKRSPPGEPNVQNAIDKLKGFMETPKPIAQAPPLPCFASLKGGSPFQDGFRYSAVPRFGPQGSKVPAGATIISSPLEFLDQFRRATLSLVDPCPYTLASGILVSAIVDDSQRKRLQKAFDDLPAAQLRSWAACEKLFIHAVLTADDSFEEARVAIWKGMRPGESYERYAWRLKRVLRVFEIQDSLSGASLLEVMKLTIPSDVMNTMNVWHGLQTLSNYVSRLKTDVPPRPPPKVLGQDAITNPDDFCLALEKMVGPDDCEDRQKLMANYRILIDEKPAKPVKVGGPEKTGQPRKLVKPDDSDDSDEPDGSEEPDEPHEAQVHTRKRPRRKEVYCDNGCGWNTSHTTDRCIRCDYCFRGGHRAENCRTNPASPAYGKSYSRRRPSKKKKS